MRRYGSDRMVGCHQLGEAVEKRVKDFFFHRTRDDSIGSLTVES